ncbi:SitI3 family protein [Kitasatospora sp. NBC_01250]
MDEQQDDMVRLASGLLERVQGDAVLNFQSEVIWLLRRDGDLSLNEQEDIWPRQRLAAVSQPFRRATYTYEW